MPESTPELPTQDDINQFCGRAEQLFVAAEQKFGFSVGGESTTAASLDMARYRTAEDELLTISVTLNEDDSETDEAASELFETLDVTFELPLPPSDEWPNIYAKERWGFGPRYIRLSPEPFDRELFLRHRLPNGRPVPDISEQAIFSEMLVKPDQEEGSMSEDEPGPIPSPETVKLISDTVSNVRLASWNRAAELFPDLLARYGDSTCTRDYFLGRLSLLAAASLAEIGCQPNPYARRD